jgi:hypothetical protein
VTPPLVISFCTLAMNRAVLLTTTLAVVGATETVIPKTVAVAEFTLDVSANDVAVTVTVAGTVAGAVYLPMKVVVDAIVPQPGEHAAPPCVRVQVTPRLRASLPTVAVKFCVPFTGTLAVPGETATAIAGTVIVAELDLVVSTTEVATMMTVRLAAGGAGAV